MDKTQEKLKLLFDYQRFAGNEHLASLIRKAENGGATPLSDDDLSEVAAAGDPFAFSEKDKKKDPLQ